MCIKTPSKFVRAWTLMEMMIAVGVFSVASAALATLFLFSIKSFTGMANYAILDKENRHAMDVLTREIREAARVNSYTTNPVTSLQLLKRDGSTVTYSFNPVANTMTRTSSLNPTEEVLLNNCRLLHFNIYKRCPSNGNWGIFPADITNVQTEVKLIELTWQASKQICPYMITNSENIQTARIVIRNQQDSGL
jgi:type II secretory pathway pseudopilin PulG